MRYSFITIKKLADLVLSDEDWEYGFTLDEEETGDDFIPTGWFGIKIDTKMFGGRSLIIGSYGFGVLAGTPLMGDDDREDIIDFLVEFIEQKTRETVDRNRYICLDNFS